MGDESAQGGLAPKSSALLLQWHASAHLLMPRPLQGGGQMGVLKAAAKLLLLVPLLPLQTLGQGRPQVCCGRRLVQSLRQLRTT